MSVSKHRLYRNISYINFTNSCDKSVTATDYSASQITANTREFLDRQEQNRTAKAISVPTNDNDIRSCLRQLKEPVTYFGEDKADRRDRLRKLLVQRRAEGFDISNIVGYGEQEDVDMQDQDEEEEEDEFYTPGEPELLEARKYMAKFSLDRARKRLEIQRRQASVPLIRHVKHRRQINEQLHKFGAFGTQSGFSRPVSATKFSPDSQYVAAGDWSGQIKVFAIPSLEESIEFQGGHTGKIGGICWSPQMESPLSMISGGLEGDVQLWSLSQNEPIGTLKGHEGRVCKVDIHNSGKFAASASFDYTWRLWDLNTEQELLLQEGHSKEVFAVKFQDDGALIGSAGLDAVGRVWDLRSGKTVMILDGHIGKLYSLDFSPNGYQIATGGDDNNVMIWDVRQVKSIFSIPAHTKMISDSSSSMANDLLDQSKYTEDGLSNSGLFWLHRHMTIQ